MKSRFRKYLLLKEIRKASKNTRRISFGHWSMDLSKVIKLKSLNK